MGGGLNTGDIPGTRELMASLSQGLKATIPDLPGVRSRDVQVPGLNGDPDVAVRVYEPIDRTDAMPALIWIHGGGYVFGSMEQDDFSAFGEAPFVDVDDHDDVPAKLPGMDLLVEIEDLDPQDFYRGDREAVIPRSNHDKYRSKAIAITRPAPKRRPHPASRRPIRPSQVCFCSLVITASFRPSARALSSVLVNHLSYTMRRPAGQRHARGFARM